jgi:hypothetical protein
MYTLNGEELQAEIAKVELEMTKLMQGLLPLAPWQEISVEFSTVSHSSRSPTGALIRSRVEVVQCRVKATL